MKAMKSMNMNRMLGTLKRKSRAPAPDEPPVIVDSSDDSPEANALRSVQSFCLSEGPNGSGEEVVYLPVIVESVDASPQAAKECAGLIRKYLSKENYAKPYIQYNAIMLIRILADNPGPAFTKNVDAKFVDTLKQLLKYGQDPSVRQLLIETMETWQRNKASDEALQPLLDMWKREYVKMLKTYGPQGARQMVTPPIHPNHQSYFSRSHHNKRLPSPDELSSRIEEARTSATLLSQTVQSTPPSEVIQNELVREFADRCQSASRSIQAYMISENPAPDNDTMETLIETNEQLTKALHQHQRAILQARKAAGINTSPSPTPSGGFAPPPGPPPSDTKPSLPARNTGSATAEDPFKDPEPNNLPFPKDEESKATGQFEDTLGVEPYHPGFQQAKQPASEVSEVVEDEKSENRGFQAKAGQKAPIYRY